jgi:hypothetical protein
MKIIKTYLAFENGIILETEKYEQEVSAYATALESIKFFLRYFIAANKLSGKIHMESRESGLYIRCDVKPNKYGKLLIAELNGRFDIKEGILLSG